MFPGGRRCPRHCAPQARSPFAVRLPGSCRRATSTADSTMCAESFLTGFLPHRAPSRLPTAAESAPLIHAATLPMAAAAVGSRLSPHPQLRAVPWHLSGLYRSDFQYSLTLNGTDSAHINPTVIESPQRGLSEVGDRLLFRRRRYEKGKETNPRSARFFSAGWEAKGCRQEAQRTEARSAARPTSQLFREHADPRDRARSQRGSEPTFQKGHARADEEHSHRP